MSFVENTIDIELKVILNVILSLIIMILSVLIITFKSSTIIMLLFIYNLLLSLSTKFFI